MSAFDYLLQPPDTNALSRLNARDISAGKKRWGRASEGANLSAQPAPAADYQLPDLPHLRAFTTRELGAPTDTRGFGDDPNAELMRTHLMPVKDFINERVRLSNPLNVPMALMGDKAAQDTIAENVYGMLTDPFAAITTYHGSPTSGIRKWDMGFRGTGEGRLAQGSETYKDMIGHGLYSAERESIGKGYQKRLAGDETTTLIIGKNKIDIDPTALHYDNSPQGRVNRFIYNLLDSGHTDSNVILDAANTYFKNSNVPEAIELLKDVDSVSLKVSKTRPGSLYETELLAHPDEFLLWDKPLSEQPEQVREVIKKHFGDDFYPEDTGEQIYRRITKWKGFGNSEKAASDYLASKGIAGIKYLDNPSRGAGEGTYNYVTFKPETEAIITHENKQRIPGAVEEAYRKMRDPKSRALLEKRYPELKGD